jgi:membrane fusion protein (multidrug efflux system)
MDSRQDAPAKTPHPVATDAAPKGARKLPTLPLALFGILVVAGGGYAWSIRDQETTDDAQVDADVIPLAVRASGLVTRVLVQENQAVKAGDIIMELDPADQLALVKQAEAELALAQAQTATALAQVSITEASAKGGLQSAQAALNYFSSGVSSAAASITAAKAALERAQADAHKAALDLQRAQALRTANAVPQERLDHAQVAKEAADAAVNQARAQLTSAEIARSAAHTRVAEAKGRLGQSTPIEAQIAAAHAAVDVARAQAQAAEARLQTQRLIFGYLSVRAPVDGTISRMSAHEGQLLSAGQGIAELVPNATYIVANFKETQIGRMRPGQLATIEVDAFDGDTLTGKVDSISSGTGARFALLPPDNATGNFVKIVQRVPVRISIMDAPKDRVLRAGLSADVTVHVKR